MSSNSNQWMEDYSGDDTEDYQMEVVIDFTSIEFLELAEDLQKEIKDIYLKNNLKAVNLYRSTIKGIENAKNYLLSGSRKSSVKSYNKSEKGKATRDKYKDSEKGKAAAKRKSQKQAAKRKALRELKKSLL